MQRLSRASESAYAQHMDVPGRAVVAFRRARILPRWIRRIDARVGRAINGHRHFPGLDRRLARLSHLADRSGLWIAIALFLYVSGGARRRAAVRGVGSLIAGSVLANLIGKRVFGGDRPLLKDVPVPRRLKKFPTSASFPSGHSASAAAFVTGVALESPRTGAMLAPLGAAVAYSRLHTGAHWLSDVVGGAALGAAVAAGGRLLKSGRAREAASRRAAPIDLPALPDGSGALILINPSSGIDPLRPEPTSYLGETLPAADLRVMTEGDDIATIVREAQSSERPPRVIGVWGGDGTVAAAADAARRAALPLLAFPGGTFNHFVRTVGAPTLDDGVQAVKAGTGERVDVAELTVDDQAPATVLNAASVGVYPDFIAERESMEPRLGKPIAALVAAVRVLARAETIDVRVDDRPARVWSVAIAAGENSSTSMVPLQRRELDDAVLDIRVLHARGALPRLRGLVALAFGARVSAALDRVPVRARLSTIESFTSTSVRLDVLAGAGEEIRIGHDGEVTISSPGEGRRAVEVKMTVVPAGLDVYSARTALS